MSESSAAVPEIEGFEQEITVLMGGWSREREVSLRSGENVYHALTELGYQARKLVLAEPHELIPGLYDVKAKAGVIFNCLHGGIGEDGTLQALLDVLQIRYTGSPALASRLALDKLLAKRVFVNGNISTPPWLEFKANAEAQPELIARELGFPVVIKPVHEGSSIGVRIVDRPDDFMAAWAATVAEFGAAYVERYIPGKEITAAILRQEGMDRVLPLIELRPRERFYSYRAKYMSGATEFIVPAELQAEVAQHAAELSLRAHRALGCFGFSRVDLRVSPSGDVFVLEVNTVPGMTETSDLPLAARATGISFGKLVEYMLQTALEPKGAVPEPETQGQGQEKKRKKGKKKREKEVNEHA